MPPARPHEERIALRQRQAKLVALTNHPAWEELVAVVDEEQAKKHESFRFAAFSGKATAPALSQREVDYWRGFLDGTRWVVRLPVTAEQKLERELRAANEGA
jgi:hypothetical protein